MNNCINTIVELYVLIRRVSPQKIDVLDGGRNYSELAQEPLSLFMIQAE